MEDKTFKIQSFQQGINKYTSEALLKPYEAVDAKNCVIAYGNLKTFCEPSTYLTIGATSLDSLSPFYSNVEGKEKHLMYRSGDKLKQGTSDVATLQTQERLDSLNFEYKGDRLIVFSSKGNKTFKVWVDKTDKTLKTKQLKNRRPKYAEDGTIESWIGSDGKEYATEDAVATYAPQGDFCELHYDRLWIAGEKENPDRVYFSTASVNGADIEDFTTPIEEGEANQHGGFIEVRSYDGSKIIGMKVIFNSVVIFKNKSAYKVFGNSPDNYQMVQLFNSNGAIADKSICVGANGAFYLNSDGIYFYDGTNANPISQKLKGLFDTMTQDYASKSVAYFYDNKYYVAIPTNSSETLNTLIEYDTTSKAFMVMDIGNITSMCEYENKLLLSDGVDIKDLLNGTNALNMKWESPMIDMGLKNVRKLCNYIYFRGKGNGKVKFTSKTERNTKVLEVMLDGTEKLFRKKLKNKGRMVKLTIENVDNSNIEVSGIEYNMEMDLD